VFDGRTDAVFCSRRKAAQLHTARNKLPATDMVVSLQTRDNGKLSANYSL
jgi:hypothetical protein